MDSGKLNYLCNNSNNHDISTGRTTLTHDLHRRFRTMITLLTLVTAINNNGQPRSSVGQKGCPGALEETLQIHNQLLNSITLLLRNHDNIAIAINSSYKVLAFRVVSVEQEVDSDDESEYQESKSSKSATEAPPPNIIAITMPQEDDNYAFIDNLYLLLEKGTSHIGKRFGDWDELLAIP